MFFLYRMTEACGIAVRRGANDALCRIQVNHVLERQSGGFVTRIKCIKKVLAHFLGYFKDQMEQMYSEYPPTSSGGREWVRYHHWLNMTRPARLFKAVMYGEYFLILLINQVDG